MPDEHHPSAEKAVTPVTMLIARYLTRNKCAMMRAPFTDLKRRPKGDVRKAHLAARLRAETRMIWPWMAERLAMGHWPTASNATRSMATEKTPAVISH